MKIHIKNGHLVDPANNINTSQDIFIAAEKLLVWAKVLMDLPRTKRSMPPILPYVQDWSIYQRACANLATNTKHAY